MKLSKPAIAVSAVVLLSVTILFSCKKINQSTELGSGLIPEVDNIHTFDTTLSILAFNDSFTYATDSSKAAGYTGSVYTALEYYVGLINDPLFGKTDAKIFFQVGPQSFGTLPFVGKPDSLHIDSVVLVMNYKSLYGDSTAPETVKVYEMSPNQNFHYDSVYSVRRPAYTTLAELGSRTFLPSVLNDSIKVYKDTTANQLRIRLDDAFGQRLLEYDTTTLNGHVAAYKTDSAFKLSLAGLAVQATSGNALLGFDLEGANTKLAIYYRDDNNGAAVQDTAVTYFAFKTTSASANVVSRDFTGSPAEATFNGVTLPDDNFVYIQSTPGSYARLKIPGLTGLSNRVIHQAELIMEEVYDPSDALFTPPQYLYIDAYDPANTRNRTLPYDLIYDGSSSFNYADFGAFPVDAKDNAGNIIKAWHFNISRYVQNLVNGNLPTSFDLRLYCPFYTDNVYIPTVAATSQAIKAKVNSSIATYARGRVRLGGGSHPTQRMRLRLVYSKI